MSRGRTPRIMHSALGATGVLILVIIVGAAVLGPLLAPHSTTEPVGAPGAGPSSSAWLGTDALGRDVLSRALNGGLSVLLLGSVATVLVMGIGLVIGMSAGYMRGRVEFVLMRLLDVVLSFPALLLILLLVSGLGTSIPVLLAGVVAVQVPAVARLVRAATQEISTRSYVEAAVARGERTPAILARDVLPNISTLVLADLGVRFGYSVILIASMNFLGLGLAPPAADWGLMVSENRQIIGLNPAAVLVPAVLLAVLTVAVNLVADAYGSSRRVWVTLDSVDSKPEPALP